MITAAVFAKKDYVSRDGHVPLMFRLTIHRKVYTIKLDKRIKIEDWDENLRRAKESHPNAQLFNAYLAKIESKAEKIILEAQLTERVITFESFLREYEGLSPYDFYHVASKYYDTKRGISSPGYLQKIEHVVGKLKEFSPKLEIHQVDYDFVIRFIAHLREKRHNCQNTINTNIKVLRRIFRLAIKLKVIKENPFSDYQLTTIKVERPSLTMPELKKYEDLLNYNLSGIQHQVLCWFLLAVYSGRRYDDLRNFETWIFLHDRIVLKQAKRIAGREQPKEITVFLHQKLNLIVSEIISRNYRPLTNSKANVILKSISELAGIKKNISFHSARHTFANINKRLTQDLTVRRDLLGHDSIKSSLIYDHVDQDLLKETILKWDKL